MNQTINKLNHSNKDEKLLVKHIKTITNSGLETIDASLWANIRDLLKKSPSLLDKAFDALMIELRKPHAEIRHLAFMLCNQLFKGSHNFRLKVIQKFEDILELTAGTNTNKKLPPPVESAKRLTALSLQTVLDWKLQFAEKYPDILDHYYFLKRCKNVDFKAVKRDAEAAVAAKVEREREQERVRRLMFDSFIEEFEANEADISELITVVNNCTALLIPTPDDFFLENDEKVSDIQESADFDMRLFGLRPSYNLELKINHEKKLRVDRNDENAAVVDNLKDSVKVAKKRFVGLLDKWEDVVNKYSDDSSYIGRVDDLKTRLNECLTKYQDLEIHGCDDSDDDADMIEVVKDDYEADIMPVVRQNGKLCDPQPSTSKDTSQPSPSSSALVPDWQDPELLAQLKATTGIDLKMPERRRKGEKKKKPTLGDEVQQTIRARNFPGIANVGLLKNNPKARLKKKIFSRSAVKRVADAYNQLDRRKHAE